DVVLYRTAYTGERLLDLGELLLLAERERHAAKDPEQQDHQQRADEQRDHQLDQREAALARGVAGHSESLLVRSTSMGTRWSPPSSFQVTSTRRRHRPAVPDTSETETSAWYSTPLRPVP